MRTNRYLTLAIVGVLAATVSQAWAVNPTPAEMERAHAWVAERFGDGDKAPSLDPPFSFKYGERPSAELLKTWELKRATHRSTTNGRNMR